MQLENRVSAQLERRYKRFLADVVLEDGEEITVHCPNTGAMTGCAEPGSRVWLAHSSNPKRKYAYTWELTETPAGDWICVHSALANRLVEEAVEAGVIAELQGYSRVRREQKYGAEGSRIDLLLDSPEQSEKPACYVEVKSCTLLLGDGLGAFPDAVSDRGRKHLRELISIVEGGERAVLLFCVQHSGIDRVAPADSIDPRYGETLREAMAAGVEVLAYRADISAEEIMVRTSLSVLEREPVANL